MKKAKVLVVDDSNTYQMFAKLALETAGFDVIQSQDVWISRTVHSEMPDVILMDVSLGGAKGTSAVSAIKKWDAGKGIQILLHSAQSDEALKQLSADCGADGYIRKEGDASQLVLQVEQAVRKSYCIKKDVN